jgi:rubrerythrin
MNIEKFMDISSELEDRISEVYEKTAALTNDESAAKTLRKISREELNHSNALKMGKRYLKEMPDLFLNTKMDEEEIRCGLEEILALEAKLAGNLLFLPGLKCLLSLETRFEHIHIGVSVVMADPSLKDLFQSLTNGDQNHIATLSSMIAKMEPPQAPDLS